MQNWINAEDAVKTFVVSEEKLAKFSRRGNLSFRYFEDARSYNVDQLSNLFPRRGEELNGIKLGSAFSTLGQIRISENGRKANKHFSYKASDSPLMRIA